MEMVDITKVKLVIWDLDDTFWEGTLSEGPVTIIDKNVETLKYLVDHGVMNSIVSKNDFEAAKSELEKHGLWEYFVFPSIDWTPKGARVKGVIEDMALRPDNVLFVDDNAMNLREASFSLPRLMTLDAADIQALWASLPALTKADPERKRLKQYRILETKREARIHSGSIDDFLRESQISVTIRKPEKEELERIHEMVMRTNQLNYTKDRCSLGELENQYYSSDFDLGIAEASDRYGDYGIVGFYSLDKRSGRLRHFLFSCRTLGMGIEQYVYQRLGFPALNVCGEVANPVVAKNIVDWINIAPSVDRKESKSAREDHKIKVLIKGPCDLAGTIDFLNANGVAMSDELNYVNSRGIAISGFNHTANILQGADSPTDALNSLVAQAPMIDEGIFRTQMFDQDWDAIFFSLLPDCHEGVYRRKSDGLMFTFSSFNFDFTDPANWDAILSGELNTHNYRFTREDLVRLHRDFSFIGHLQPDEIADNIESILKRLPPTTTLVLMLGNTKGDPNASSAEFKGQVTVNRQVNERIKKRFSAYPNVRLIDYTDVVESDDDAKDANHLSRRARYRIAQKMEAILDEITGSKAHKRSQGSYLWAVVIRTLRRISRLARRKADRRRPRP